MRDVCRTASDILAAAAFERGHRSGYTLGLHHGKHERRARQAMRLVVTFTFGALAGAVMAAL